MLVPWSLIYRDYACTAEMSIGLDPVYRKFCLIFIGSGVKRNSWPIIVYQLFCFSE